MKIEKITLYCGKMPVKVLFSYGTLPTFSFLIVNLSGGGLSGWGEAMVPLPESMAPFLKNLIGIDGNELDNLLPKTFESPLERIAYEGVSMALHDLAAREKGISVRKLLSPGAADSLALMPCAFPVNPQDAGLTAAKFAEQGFRHLKIKLIGDLQEDLQRIKAVRAAAPSLELLQADANCGYKTLDDACEAVKLFGDAGLDYFEDPLQGSPDDYRRLRERCRGGRAMVMIDEFARTPETLQDALERNAADIINVHPDQPGSFSTVRKQLAIARKFNVPLTIGGTGYTGIGSGAYWQLCAALLPESPCGELGGFFDHGMPVNSARMKHTMTNGVLHFDSASVGCGTDLDVEAITPYVEEVLTF